VTFDCARKEHLAPAPTGAASLSDADLSRWLKPDRMVPLDDTIRKWAREVVTAAGAHTDLEMARAIYNHVVATVKYDKTGKGWGRGDIYYACDARRGNCTDFHAIFIGYARAMGIPARFSIGFPIPSERAHGAMPAIIAGRNSTRKGSAGIPSTPRKRRRIPPNANTFLALTMKTASIHGAGRDFAAHAAAGRRTAELFHLSLCGSRRETGREFGLASFPGRTRTDLNLR